MPTSVDIYRYTLRASSAMNALRSSAEIEGVLLRIDGGFACLQPWVELGDMPLSQQLHALRIGTSTPLLDRAIACAAMDADARNRSRSLFSGLQIPQSHATIIGDLTLEKIASVWKSGFRMAKIKMGRNWQKQLINVRDCLDAYSDLQLRFDFNACLDVSGFMEFACAMDDRTHDATDFIEDPFPFDRKLWLQCQADTGLKFAADRWCSDDGAEEFIGIVKPAVFDAAALLDQALRIGRPMVVTTNMDHPLGCAWAAYHATLYSRAAILHGPCGLCTSELFDLSPHPVPIHSSDAVPVFPLGNGLGFDEYLNSVSWEKWC